MRNKSIITIACLAILFLSACGTDQVNLTPTSTSTLTSTETSIPSPTSTFTSTPPPSIIVKTSTNCFSGPGGTYDIVMTFEEEDQAEIVGRDDTGSYWIIKNPDEEGGCWIESQMVTTEGELGYTPYLIPPPTSTPAAPAAPENISAYVSCSHTRICKRGWGDYCYRWETQWEVNIKLWWEDHADNELGFEVLKNGIKLTSLQANTTEYSDWFAGIYYFKGTNDYTIQAYNQVGVSTPVEISVDYICPNY